MGIDEFLYGCNRLKGPARNKDVLKVKMAADTLVESMNFLETVLDGSERKMVKMERITRALLQRVGVEYGADAGEMAENRPSSSRARGSRERRPERAGRSAAARRPRAAPCGR